MELTCELSPLVFAELYRLLLADDKTRRRVEHRVAEAEGDPSWLEDAERRYRDWWCWQVENQAFGDIQGTSPAELRDAQLATWLIAPLRALGRSSEFGAELQRAVNLAARAEFPGAGYHLPAQYQASVVAWTLGRVCGELDRTVPVVPAEVPEDQHVAAAYDGLLHHVSALSDSPDPWPEMAGSAIIWRVGGIADGLRPQYPKPNLAASLGQLMTDLKPVVPPGVHASLSRGWGHFRDARNSFTHVAARDGIGFADFVGHMRCAADVRAYLEAATYFVCNEVAMNLSTDDDPRGRDRMLVERLDRLNWLP